MTDNQWGLVINCGVYRRCSCGHYLLKHHPSGRCEATELLVRCSCRELDLVDE